MKIEDKTNVPIRAAATHKLRKQNLKTLRLLFVNLVFLNAEQCNFHEDTVPVRTVSICSVSVRSSASTDSMVVLCVFHTVLTGKRAGTRRNEPRKSVVHEN